MQNQINDLKNAISSFSSSDSSHVSVNKIHDDVLASIKFELQNIVVNQEQGWIHRGWGGEYPNPTGVQTQVGEVLGGGGGNFYKIV